MNAGIYVHVGIYEMLVFASILVCHIHENAGIYQVVLVFMKLIGIYEVLEFIKVMLVFSYQVLVFVKLMLVFSCKYWYL